MSGPWLAEPNETVQIRGRTTYDGQLADIVQRVRRRRTHQTSTLRHDYQLRVGSGKTLWFSDAEIQPYQAGKHQRWWAEMDPFDAACHIAGRIDSLLAGVEDEQTLADCQEAAGKWMRDLQEIRIRVQNSHEGEGE